MRFIRGTTARLVIGILLGFALAGCSTPTKLESASTAAGAANDPATSANRAAAMSYRRPLVCGVARSPEVRRQIEEAFKRELNARGVDAVPSFDYLPETRQADEKLFTAVVTNSKADSILLTRLAKVERRADAQAAGAPRPEASIPPTPSADAPPGAYGVYAWGWGAVSDPPQVYAAVDSVVLETFLVDARTSAVIWRGATRVLDPSKVPQVATDTAKQVVADLIKRGLVPGVAR
jgi:hypothetical protein